MWVGLIRRLTIRTNVHVNHAGHFAYQLREPSLWPPRCSVTLIRAKSSDIRRPYTEAEDKMIRELRDKDQSWGAIAKQTGRSAPSVRARWYGMLDGRSSGQLTPRYFLKEEDEAITRLRDEGLSWSKISTALGRSKLSVKNRWHHHISDRSLRRKEGRPPRVYSTHLDDDEVNQLILQRVGENKWFTEIAEELGCSDSTVGMRYKRLCQAKGEPNAYAAKFENRDLSFAEKIVHLRTREGLSDKAIAISLGIDSRTVAQHLRRSGLKSVKAISRRPIDTDERRLIIDRHEHGLGPSQIAKECNRTLSVVKWVLYSHSNPAPKPRKWLKADIEEFQRLRMQGVPQNIIAEKLGRSLASIRSRAAKLS